MLYFKMDESNRHLLRDCRATRIPAGDEVVLPKGSPVEITQSLGGSYTVRSGGDLFRLAPDEFDALGDDIAAKQSHDIELPTFEAFSDEQVWQALKSCFDPEIPVNIVDLGLIYDLISEETEFGRFHVAVRMTLTAQGCGMGPSIAADAKAKIEGLTSVESADVEIVWDPVWTPHMISQEGRKMLGLD